MSIKARLAKLEREMPPLTKSEGYAEGVRRMFEKLGIPLPEKPQPAPDAHMIRLGDTVTFIKWRLARFDKGLNAGTPTEFARETYGRA